MRFSVKNRKRALCAFDDKRFLLADGLHTLAFGHAELTAAIEPVECVAHPTAIAANIVRLPGTPRMPATSVRRRAAATTSRNPLLTRAGSGVDPAADSGAQVSQTAAAAAAAAALAENEQEAQIDFRDLIGGAGVDADDDEAAQEADYINALAGDEDVL